MPFFRYLARDKTGKLIEEVVETISKEDLVNSLHARALYIISIGPAAKSKEVKRVKRRYHHGVRMIDLVMFSRELATLLGSGVTLIRSLDILCKQIESRVLLTTVEKIKKDVEGGYTFQNALKKHDKIFSEFWINLVETGEASGHLPLSLEQLAMYLEESSALRGKIISAMIYPMILLCVATLAITVFLLKIIPIFSDIFKGFDIKLPLITQIVINASEIVRRYFLIGVGGIIALFFIVKKYISTDIGRWQFDSFKFRLPLLGQVVQEVSTERFASGLSTLLRSGVPILHAIDIAEKISGNKVMEKELREIKQSVRDGKGIGQSMQNSNLFSPLVVQMISVGEEIGELSKMLEKISKFYKERVNVFIARLTAMFEPLALVFMGVVVGVIVVAMFMPVFSISSAIKAAG